MVLDSIAIRLAIEWPFFFEAESSSQSARSFIATINHQLLLDKNFSFMKFCHRRKVCLDSKYQCKSVLSAALG